MSGLRSVTSRLWFISGIRAPPPRNPTCMLFPCLPQTRSQTLALVIRLTCSHSTTETCIETHDVLQYARQGWVENASGRCYLVRTGIRGGSAMTSDVSTQALARRISVDRDTSHTMRSLLHIARPECPSSLHIPLHSTSSARLYRARLHVVVGAR